MSFMFRPATASFRRPRPKRPPRLTNQRVVERFNQVRPTEVIDGRITILEFEKWEPLRAGTLGAIFYYPPTGQRWLYCIDFETGLPRKLDVPLAPRPTRRPMLLTWGGHT